MKSERYSKFLAGLVTSLILFSLVISPALAAAGDTTRVSLASNKTRPGQDGVALAQASKISAVSNATVSFAPGVVLVGLKQGVSASKGVHGAQTTDLSLNEAFARLGVQDVEPVFSGATNASLASNELNTNFDLSRIYRLHLSPDADVLRIVQELKTDPSVVYAEPDYLAHIIATPNDAEYSNQWGLTKISAPAAWDTTTGSSDVVVAVVDAGIDVTHPDLSGQLWQNPGEIAGNGIDDDNNGYIDDIHGWNLVNNNADLSDNTGHGTQVAGIIAATTNNGVGIAGVCWQCRLMVVKVVSSGGVANYSDIAAGVAYAAQKGAKVINLSLGGNSDSITLKAAVASASSTAVVVGGAGNDNSSAAFYPAAYDDYVLAVAGTTQTDTKVSTSNYGTWVDVSAPGEAIRTTFSGGTYADSSGTSMAAPFVAGLAGLIRSQNPTWSANLTRAQIINTTDNIDGVNPGYEGKLGSGRINAQMGVNTSPQSQLTFFNYTANGELNGKPDRGETVNLFVNLFNEWNNASNVQGTLTTTDSNVTVVTSNATFGTINTYATQQNATAFVFNVAGGAPYNHPVVFNLNLVADGGYAVTVSFTVTTASGIQQVSGVIPTDTTWTADIEYLVTGNILIPSGVTLTVEPGTMVRVQGGKSFRVDGNLVANGEADALIRFTSAMQTPFSESDYWSGISFVNGGKGVFTYCWFEYSYLGLIGVVDNSVLVEHSFFTNNKQTLLSIQGSGLSVIRYNRFWNNIIGGGNLIDLNGAVEFTNNLVYDNHNVDDAMPFSILRLSQGTVVSNTIISNNANGLETSLATGFHNNNLFGNIDPFVNMSYDVRNIGASSVTMPAVYWGDETTAEMIAEGPNSNIEAIYDYFDDFTLGQVNYTGWLISPEPTAPRFLWQFSTSPGSPVGIQQVTFNLNFSAPMDQSINPVAMFYSTKRGTTTTYTKSNTGNGLPNDNVNAVAIDGNGNKWFGTSGGVGRFDGTNWTAYTSSNSGLPANDVVGLALDSVGTKWISTMSSGKIAKFDGTTWTTFSCGNVAIPCGYNNAIAIDNNGVKWFGKDNLGVVSFDGTTWTDYTSSNSGLPNGSVRTIAIDKDGSKWFGTTIGVARFDGATWTVYNSSNSSLPDYAVSAIAIDRDGSKWFGTQGGGVAHFDGTTWTVYNNSNTGAPINWVTSIAIDNNGIMWFAGNASIIRFDGTIWSIPPNAPTIATQLTSDSSNNLWISTGNGAAVLWGGQDYAITQNAQWLNNTQWRATYDITSLVPRGTYTASVSSAMGTDGMEIPTDTRFGFTVDYAGTISDQTPPNPPSVYATGKPSDVSAVEASWSASDPDSSIIGYRYAIGSTAGAVDIVNWTITSATSLTRSGLGLVAGRQYWIAVQAQNAGGLWSASGNSAFVAGQQSPRLLYLPLILR
jgi:subtilisin family serine protease